MKVCIIGTGYVGLVTGAGLAEMGNHVICVDNDASKITQLKQGVVPIYEPGIEDLLDSNTREGRITFTIDLTNAVIAASVIMIAVGTPEDADGSADLRGVHRVADDIAKAMETHQTGYKVIAMKSTVPVGTAQNLKARIAEKTRQPFAVVSNPEFLKQGNAVDDFLNPDRVILGTDDPKAADLMRELYSPFLRSGNPFIYMDVHSAELTKYAANAFLATKISFINEMAKICDHVGADIGQVRIGISSDHRIGEAFLYPGLGYGGSCFPKDVKALINTASAHGHLSALLQDVDQINQRQRSWFVSKVLEHFDGDIEGKKLALWGLSFKPRTDDMREAPSQTIIEELLAHGAQIQVFDPKAFDNAKQIFGQRIRYVSNAYDVLEGADALLLITEWNEFRRPDFDLIKQKLSQPVIFDGRNQYDLERMAERDFYYYSLGRPDVKPTPSSSTGIADTSSQRTVSV